MQRRKPLIEVLDEIHAYQREMGDGLVVEDAGLTVYTKADGISMSPGCQACKTGKWLCLFVGKQCNAKCKSCPQVITPDLVDYPDSFVGMWMHDAVTYTQLFQGDHIDGVSYSGGEPLMYIDKIERVASEIATTCPDVYQWVYTNGILVDEEKLRRLQAVGISEIRFNLVATHFNRKTIAKLELAAKYIDRVTVEVPSIAETWDHLIEQREIHALEDAGVTQLNLAELYLYTPKAWDTWGHEELYAYNSNFYQAQSPVFSRRITCAIMKYAIENDLKILVNDCSNDTKHLQVVKRNTNPVLCQTAKEPDTSTAGSA